LFDIPARPGRSFAAALHVAQDALELQRVGLIGLLGAKGGERRLRRFELLGAEQLDRLLQALEVRGRAAGVHLNRRCT
jgi:hypothetical protein